MKPKTEELLWMLLWTCDAFSRPTFRNLTDSFEGWAYRNGFLRQIQRLERKEMLEARTSAAGDRLYRLSRAGRLLALGGQDPVEKWSRRWDGRWRLVLFDIQESRRATRNQLRRYLRSRGFGYLQNSVWITPDPVSEESTLLAGGPVDVESLVFLEARPCAGESDAEVVDGAWDFAAINEAYASHQKWLKQRPRPSLDGNASACRFQGWLRAEHQLWLEAVRLDPLLPKALLPAGYAGRTAWQRRLKVLTEAGHQMRAFRID